MEDPLGVILVFRTPPPSYPVFPVCPPSFPAVPFPPIPCQAVLASVWWGRLGRHPEFAAIPDSLTSLRELELGEDWGCYIPLNCTGYFAGDPRGRI